MYNSFKSSFVNSSGVKFVKGIHGSSFLISTSAMLTSNLLFCLLFLLYFYHQNDKYVSYEVNFYYFVICFHLFDLVFKYIFLVVVLRIFILN